MLLIVGVYFACRRKRIVNIPSFNDSKIVATIIYFCFVTIAIVVVFRVALSGYLNIGNAMYSGILLINVLCILGLLYIPKVSICVHCMHASMHVACAFIVLDPVCRWWSCTEIQRAKTFLSSLNRRYQNVVRGVFKRTRQTLQGTQLNCKELE